MWLAFCSGILLVVGANVFAIPLFDDQENRVVNGTDAVDGEFPFVVSLRRTPSGFHSCGASILSPNWVLTAAHCVDYTSPSAYEIQYGGVLISPTGPNVIAVAEIRRHLGYDSFNNYKNDIAVLRLSTPLEFNSYVGPVTLPSRMQDTAGGSNATLIGWGVEASGGDVQEILQKVDYFVPSHEDCARIHNNGIHDSNICGYYPGGGKGQCSGDSGGPLLVNGQQVGIVSWSVKPCGVAPYPGVFTRVSHFVDWIAENTGLDL